MSRAKALDTGSSPGDVSRLSSSLKAASHPTRAAAASSRPVAARTLLATSPMASSGSACSSRSRSAKMPASLRIFTDCPRSSGESCRICEVSSSIRQCERHHNNLARRTCGPSSESSFHVTREACTCPPGSRRRQAQRHAAGHADSLATPRGALAADPGPSASGSKRLRAWTDAHEVGRGPRSGVQSARFRISRSTAAGPERCSRALWNRGSVGRKALPRAAVGEPAAGARRVRGIGGAAGSTRT